MKKKCQESVMHIQNKKRIKLNVFLKCLMIDLINIQLTAFELTDISIIFLIYCLVQPKWENIMPLPSTPLKTSSIQLFFIKHLQLSMIYTHTSLKSPNPKIILDHCLRNSNTYWKQLKIKQNFIVYWLAFSLSILASEIWWRDKEKYKKSFLI